MTFEFKVPTMACSACANTIAQAVRDRDPLATVTGDPATKRVTVETADLSEAVVREAIAAAGYPVEA